MESPQSPHSSSLWVFALSAVESYVLSLSQIDWFWALSPIGDSKRGCDSSRGGRGSS